MIPFKYGSIVSGEDFCGREETIKLLTEYLRSSQNVMVQGERRIGKTSLIYETTRRMKNYQTMLVDIMEVKTSDDLCRRMIKAIISLESKGSVLTKILKSFSSLRPQLGVDPITGMPTVSLDRSIEFKPDALDGIFDLLESLNKHLVVVYDEFQDVLNIPDERAILAALRSRIQYHDRIAYVFAGSIRNKTDRIFTDPESPLFKSAIPISVGPIGDEDFFAFIRNKFRIGDRTISDQTLKRIFDSTDRISGDIQQLCEALWSVTNVGDSISEVDLTRAFELIFSRESKSYELIISELTALQLKCLTALARVGGKRPTSAKFLKESGIRQPSSVSKALSKLMKRKIIFLRGKSYRFVNPFFSAWLNAKGF